MQLYLVRHGQSLNNSRPQEQRVEDPPLTDLGHQQAGYLADWVRATRITTLVSSPFLRTLETAEYPRRAWGLKAEIWVELHELGGCVRGALPQVMQGRPGMTHAEIRDQFPGFELVGDIDGEGWWRSRPYETVPEATVRAAALATRTRAEFGRSAQRVAYVMHGDFILIFLRTLLELADREVDKLGSVYNASVTRIDITPDQTRLEYFNEVVHMPRELVT